MPFDTMTASRPYMRWQTAALAAQAAQDVDGATLEAIAAELAQRTRKAARDALRDLRVRLDTMRYMGETAPIVTPEPVAEPDPAPAAPSKPRQAPKATKSAMGQSRDENQAARRAHFALLCKAQDAAERECGRASDGQSVWAGVPGAAHMVRVPAELGVYVTLAGKAQREPRDRVYPAPRFWPGGALPEGYEDLGPHQPRVAFKAQPGSAEWRKWVEVQNRVMKPDDNSAMANRAFNVMHDKPRRRRAA